MLSLIKNLKTTSLKFEDNLNLEFNFFKANSDDSDTAEMQIMANCESLEDAFDLFGLFEQFCVKKSTPDSNCLLSQA